jgi:hypothetical protein
MSKLIGPVLNESRVRQNFTNIQIATALKTRNDQHTENLQLYCTRLSLSQVADYSSALHSEIPSKDSRQRPQERECERASDRERDKETTWHHLQVGVVVEHHGTYHGWIKV